VNFTWTKQSIDWLEQASKVTPYYQDLAKLCRPFLLQSDSLIDIGCGTGNFSLAFASYVKRVTAVDINPLAIEILKQKCQGLNLENIYPRESDWKDISEKSSFEIVFISYVNGLASGQLNKLASLSSRLIIGVLPKYGREKSFGLENYITATNEKNSSRDTFSKAISYLQNRGIPFQAKEFSCDFGQPFASMQEYQSFLNFYFDIKASDIPTEYTEKYLQKTSQGYYLPNVKECGIIIIRKEDVK
jgi:SAM-dependent methyltransferase